MTRLRQGFGGQPHLRNEGDGLVYRSPEGVGG